MKRRRQKSEEPVEEIQVSRKSKRRKESFSNPWDIPVELYSQTQLCHRLYDAIRTLKDSDNCLLSEFVVRLPNRRSVPDYYKIVPHPIDLIKIQQKLKTDEYLSVPLFISDIRLLIDNVKLFYKVSSLEYKRTIELEVEFLKILQELTFSDSDIKSPLSPKTVSWKLSSLNKTLVQKSTPSVPAGANVGNNKKTPTSVKATRSKAWLDEFIASDDPVKIYFADVFSYHDSNGEYISQPFIDLPSEKDYPEYYRIITEPIGLATIKNQIESGFYQNLKQIQEDMLLMIKNAQYFNEPQSNIYKMATALRKIIINRCIELERKYKTVEKTTKLPSPVQKHDNDDSESDDVSCSESDGEVESEDGKKKLLLHIKRDKLKTTKDRLDKLLKKKSPPPLRKVLSALYHTLVHANEEGRILSDLFMKRPSPKLYPEYYIVIATPIDFKEINSKIKKDVYKSLSQMIDDVELLVNNATTFNEEYSQIHTDALALRAITHSSIERLQAHWPHHFITTYKKLHLEKNKCSTIATLFAVVRNCIDSTGRKLSQSFQDPPKEVEVYSGGKKILGLAAIAEKVDNNTYGSVHELFTDLCYLYNRYCEVSPPQSSLFKDVVSLHRITVSKYNELTNEQRNAFQYPNAIETIKKMFRDFIDTLFKSKDDNGRTFKEFFQHVVVTQQPTENTKSSRTLSMEKICQWIQLGRYSRLDQLQEDLMCIFKQSHSMDDDLVSRTLEKQYVNLRNEFFSPVLSSPAFQDRTIKHIEEEEKAEEKEEEDDIAIEMDTTNPINSLILPPISERSSVKYFQIGEVTYFPGDFIYLPPQQSHLPPQIVLIESLWTDAQESPWFNGCWFFRPHETFHIATRKFYEQEVFKSDFYSSGQLNKTLGKCYVLFIKEYTKFFPQGFSEGDVYVCESRYQQKTKNFKRIKFWNVQENVCVKLLPRLTQCVLNKVPSVFATEGIIKSDQGDVIVSTREVKEEEVEEDNSELNSSEQSLETSFFRELKDVTLSVLNSEANFTYYEQYCIDDKVFKLGDFVCVRSDQELPFIARIDKMWTDSNDDPWFRGPWFVRVKEVQHLPTCMFYERELFMSNIHDSNPMRSIMRKCAVLYISDYTKWRPTEIPETDVFVCDSRYNEEEKQIKKMKSFKHNEYVSSSVLRDEKYYLPEDLFLWKCHSPKLYPPTVSIPITPTTCNNATVATSSAPPTVSLPTVATPLNPPVVSASGGQVTISLQQLQSLITSSLINPKLVQQQQQQSPLALVQSQLQSEPTILAYPCLWEGCTEVFTDISELSLHIIRSNHLQPEPEGSYYYCSWSNCSRRRDSRKPFDSLQKISRHVKEVHLLKIHPQITLGKSSLNTVPSVVKDTKKLPTVQISPLATMLPSSSIISPSVTPLPLPLTTTTTTTTPPLQSEPVTMSNSRSNIVTQPVAPVQSNADITDPLETQHSISGTPPSVFVTPPSNQREIFHTKLYRNHIERMRNNEDTISPQPPTSIPLSVGSSDQWIDSTAIPDGMTPSEALYHLYHHMLYDAVKISNWLDTV